MTIRRMVYLVGTWIIRNRADKRLACLHVLLEGCESREDVMRMVEEENDALREIVQQAESAEDDVSEDESEDEVEEDFTAAEEEPEETMSEHKDAVIGESDVHSQGNASQTGEEDSNDAHQGKRPQNDKAHPSRSPCRSARLPTPHRMTR